MEQSPEILTAILAAHQARRDRADPLLAPAKPLPAPEADDRTLSCPGGFALVRNTEADADGFMVSFSAAHESRLAPKVDGSGAFAELLDLWAAEPSYRPGPDSVATVTWPSRDTAVTRSLVERGFAPQTVFAVRLAGRPTSHGDGSRAAADTGVTVRRFEHRDFPSVTGLWVESVVWDAQFGAAALRSSTRARIEDQVTGVAGGEEKWGWVAERDGTVVGFVAVQPPGYSDWAAHTVRVSPAAYLGTVG